MKRKKHTKGHADKHSTKKWEKCIKKTRKYCLKHKRGKQSVKTCSERICASIKHKYKG